MNRHRFLQFSLLSIFFLFYFTISYSQNTVSGSIVDATNNEPLIGANIIVLNTSPVKGTVSDANGDFEIEASGASIKVSYVGYIDTTITNLTASQKLLIKMKRAASFTKEVQVIASATPIELNIPAPLMKIPRRHLERDNEVSILSSLNRIPGVYMQSGALNTNRITIRGIGNRSLFSTTKIRSYLDDIPLTSGIGETTIEDIDLSLIEEVEVWKGPTASTYGAGLGGLILLKSRNTKSDNLGSNLAINNTFGSYGLFRNASNFQYVSPKGNTVLNLNYNNTHSDGYRDNNEYDRQGYTALAKIETGPKNQLTVLANFTHLKAFIPSSIDRDDFDNEPTAAAFSWGSVMGFEDSDKVLFGISNQNQLSDKLTNTTSLFTTYRGAYELRPFNILDENSVATGGRTRFSFNNGSKFSFDVGGELFNEQYDWKTFDTDVRDSLLSDNEEIRTFYNLFFESKLELSDQLNLTAGFNFNNTKYTYTDLFLANGDNSGEYSFQSIFSPRISLSYFPQPKLMLFATVSHGFSPPTLEETLTPDGTINPDIQPEKGWNFEIGSRGRYLNNRFSYELALYSMRIQDLLVARRTAADQFIGINAGKTTHNGLEVFAQYQLAQYPNNLDVYFSYHYANYSFDEFVDGDNDYSGNELTGQPPHVFSFGLDFSPFKNGFYGNINFQYTDAFPMRDNNSIYSDSYSIINMRVGYKLKLGTNWNLNFHAGINNLADEKYASMILINAGSFGGRAPRYYYPGLPRNYYGGLNVNYSF